MTYFAWCATLKQRNFKTFTQVNFLVVFIFFLIVVRSKIFYTFITLQYCLIKYQICLTHSQYVFNVIDAMTSVITENMLKYI